MCSGPACALVGAPTTCGAHKTHCNRFRRWSEKGSCELIFSELARWDGTEEEEMLMVDATHVKAHCTPSLLNKGNCSPIDR